MKNSVEFKEIRIEQAKPLNDKNDALLQYWLGIQQGSAPPPKSALDPMAIPKLLPNVAIFESNSPEVVQLRLAGTRLMEVFGRNITGSNLRALIPEHLQDWLDNIVEIVIHRSCGLLARTEMTAPSGMATQVESIHLPMSDAAGEVCNSVSSAYILPQAGRINGEFVGMVPLERFILLLD